MINGMLHMLIIATTFMLYEHTLVLGSELYQLIQHKILLPHSLILYVCHFAV